MHIPCGHPPTSRRPTVLLAVRSARLNRALARSCPLCNLTRRGVSTGRPAGRTGGYAKTSAIYEAEFYTYPPARAAGRPEDMYTSPSRKAGRQSCPSAYSTQDLSISWQFVVQSRGVPKLEFEELRIMERQRQAWPNPMDPDIRRQRSTYGTGTSSTGLAHQEIYIGSRIVRKTGPNPSQISRGRWPCGREPPVERRIPLSANMNSCFCVSLGQADEIGLI